MDVEKLTSLVFDRKPLWESDPKRLSQSVFMQKKLELNEPCKYYISVFSVLM
jgi:hypothetical protein